MTVTKFAIIGLGKRSLKAYVPTLIKSPNWKLISVCDQNVEAIKAFKNKFIENGDVQAYSDISSLFNEIDRHPVDVAIIVVSHKHHYEITKRFLGIGIHVLKEKPFGMTLQESASILDLLEKSPKLKLACTVQRRFNPYFMKCKEALNQIGQVKLVSASKTLALNCLNDDWRCLKKDCGGGALIDLGYHIIDLLFYFFGEPVRVESELTYASRPQQKYDVEDGVHLLLGWKNASNQFSATVEISSVGLVKQDTISFLGTEGYLLITNDSATLYDIERSEKEKIIDDTAPEEVIYSMISEFVKWINDDNDESRDRFVEFLKRDSQIMKTIDEVYVKDLEQQKMAFLNCLPSSNHYVWPRITDAVIKAVVEQTNETLSIYNRSGIIKEFEENFKQYINAQDDYVLLCNSGTMAIDSMYRGIELMPNDLVIVPVYTFHATVSPMMHYGVIPIFCDCDSNGNIDPDQIEKICDQIRKPKAIVVTHMWGVTANMNAIVEICKRRQILLLEDCSHAHGALVDGKMVGTFGDAAAWSLQGQKILAGGQLGVLVTRHKNVYDRALIHGHYNKRCEQEIDEKSDLYKYRLTGDGYNLRSHPLAVCIANQQLSLLPAIMETKHNFAKKMVEGLKHIPFLKMPALRNSQYSPSWYAFIMKFIPDELPQLTRDKFCDVLKEAGLKEIDVPNSTRLLNKEPLYCCPHVVLPHIYGKPTEHNILRYKMEYRGQDQMVFKTAEEFFQTAIKLPVWGYKDEENIVNFYIKTISTVAHECMQHGLTMDKSTMLLSNGILSNSDKHAQPCSCSKTERENLSQNNYEHSCKIK